MEPHTIVMFGWIAGSIIHGTPENFPSKEACKAALPRAEKQFEAQLPSENYRVNAICKPTYREKSYRELAGKEGWDCFKHGKCGQDKPNAHIEIKNPDGTVSKGKIWIDK